MRAHASVMMTVSGIDDGAAPVLPVRGHQDLGAGVLDPELEGLRGEAAEHERVDRADARARERDDHGLRDDREVDDHAVALLHAQLEQGIGGLGHLTLQVRVGIDQAVPGFTLEVQGHVLTAPRCHVAVHAVVGDVELPALEPRDLGQRVGGVAVLVLTCALRLVEPMGRVPRLRPVQPPGLLDPELHPGVVGDQRRIGCGVSGV